MIDAGLQWLNEQREAFITLPITYTRGANSITNLKATRGQSVYNRIDQHGFSVRTVAIDWLVSAEELILGGEVTVQQKGDTINDGTNTYEVIPLPGDGAWKWSGPSYYTIRIHSKQIS